ncbi:small membrane protein [Klebsiella oxytoca]
MLIMAVMLLIVGIYSFYSYLKDKKQLSPPFKRKR